MSKGSPPGRLIGLKLIPERNQPSGFVMLTCTDGEQTVEVSISRTDLEGLVQQRGWRPLDPDGQETLVDTNLELGTLEPVIQAKYERRQVTRHTSPMSGNDVPVIELTRAELEQGITGTTRTYAGKLWDPSEARHHPPEPEPPPIPSPNRFFPPTVGLRSRAMASGRGTPTITPATIAALSNQDRTGLLRRLDDVEARIRELLPVIGALESHGPGDEPGIGHNRPDEPLPITTAELELGAAAVQSMRIEASIGTPRIDILEYCGPLFRWLSGRVQALARYLGAKIDKGVDVFVEATALTAAAKLAELLGVNLADLAALIAALHLRPGRRRK